MAIQDDFEKQGKWLLQYGSALVMIFLVLLIVLVSIYETAPDRFYSRQSGSKNLYEYLCLLSSIFGFVLRVAIVGHTPLKSDLTAVKGQVMGKHHSTGLYSIARHPLFIAHFFIFLGPVLVSGKVWHVFFYILIFYLYNERVMFAIESTLISKFGFRYIKWAENVPAIVPNIYLYRRPELPFNLNKVIHQETGQLAAIFIVFSAFDISIELFNEKKIGHNSSLLLVSCIITVMYLILKVPIVIRRMS